MNGLKFLFSLCMLSLHCLYDIIWITIYYSLINFNLSVFLLLLVLLVSYLRQHCLTQGHKYLVLCFILRLLPYYHLYSCVWYILSAFLHGIKNELNFTCLYVDSFHCHLLKRLFSRCIFFAPLSKTSYSHM